MEKRRKGDTERWGSGEEIRGCEDVKMTNNKND
jgi:hypothetical protein